MTTAVTEYVSTPAVEAEIRRFREFTVVAKAAESSLISSFCLEPVDDAPLPAWKAGQYLVFRLNINGESQLRNYSMSASPAAGRRLRIAVKREAAPIDRPDLPLGMVSNYLHEQINVGDTLIAAGPMGEFILDESSQRPVVLFSGGVGITPMLSMLHQLVNSTNRTVHFIHACENGQVHAFADEVLALAASRDGVHVHFCYRNPSDRDHETSRFHAQGLIEKLHLQAWLPLDDYDFYLCGPGAFMQSNWRLLRSLGVAKERIRYEFFGPATMLEADTQEIQPVVLAEKAAPPVAVKPEVQTGGDSVQFLAQTEVLPWEDQSGTLLELAEAQGLSPDFNCRSGLCNTCMCRLVSGDVEYIEEPLDMPPAGKVLLCCSRPVGAVVVDLSAS
ncbi:FAD-binding oxidoreductase [Paenalcaligenes niemegkensis]|uniref:FAD-binding oxidoreductase n=1 Tax=Paenalcaligenes niemegkensis TaxID=2895469 RepID=UPI001EE7E2D7|nr:FAD-binding oxidoreductase [Paenalcaligenes niemegkensis]MCQ9617737.1 FAD-binding oxidoreductase [Paenalcaligenes niemegkensis]